jgi:hypothetical protein
MRCLLATAWALAIALQTGDCRADGGMLRVMRAAGPLQVSAFTAPHPPGAGIVDISVMVQDAHTLEPVPAAEILVEIARRGTAGGTIRTHATSEAATNQLFRACAVELDQGEYDVAIACRGPQGCGQVEFAMKVGPAPPQVAELWPWIAWPLAPIALFAAHRLLIRRTRRGGLGSAGGLA